VVSMVGAYICALFPCAFVTLDANKCFSVTIELGQVVTWRGGSDLSCEGILFEIDAGSRRGWDGFGKGFVVAIGGRAAGKTAQDSKNNGPEGCGRGRSAESSVSQGGILHGTIKEPLYCRGS
jgi:hypothetical protein